MSAAWARRARSISAVAVVGLALTALAGCASASDTERAHDREACKALMAADSDFLASLPPGASQDDLLEAFLVLNERQIEIGLDTPTDFGADLVRSGTRTKNAASDGTLVEKLNDAAAEVDWSEPLAPQTGSPAQVCGDLGFDWDLGF